jgi:hypothetical protein
MGITFSVGTGVADSVFGKCQAPIRMFVEQQSEAFEAASPLKDLFMMDKDNSFGVTLTGMTAMRGFLPVGENGAYPQDEMQEGYKKFLEHVTWKDYFAISREAVEDGKLMNLRQKPMAFVKGYHRTREEFGARLFANAMAGKTSMALNGMTFDLTGADGVALFSKNHASKVDKKKTQCNVFSDAFSASALGKLETRMQHFEGDAGNLLDVSPTTILIPNVAAAKEAVFAAIGADKDPATSNNAFNYQFGRWNVICWSYLDKFLPVSGDSFPWMLIDDNYNQNYGGAVWYDRTELDIRSELARNDANEWLGYARFVGGFNDWRFAACGGISGADAL